MSVVAARIEIEAPIGEVWDYVLDAARMNEWVTIIDRIDHVDPGPPRTGLRMDQVLHLRGMHFKVHWTLDDVRAPRYARWEGKGPARATAVTEYRLQERGGRTQFDYHNSFTTPFGPLGAAASRVLVGGIPEKEANASLRRLKEILEARRTAHGQ